MSNVPFGEQRYVSIELTETFATNKNMFSVKVIIVVIKV